MEKYRDIRKVILLNMLVMVFMHIIYIGRAESSKQFRCYFWKMLTMMSRQKHTFKLICMCMCVMIKFTDLWKERKREWQNVFFKFAKSITVTSYVATLSTHSMTEITSIMTRSVLRSTCMAFAMTLGWQRVNENLIESIVEGLTIHL